MARKHQGDEREQLDREFDKLERRLPRPFQKLVHWLRRPGAIWVRIPLALLFFGAGFLGFLPILGFWMAPLGVLLLAEDIPFLRSPVRRAMVGAERTYDRLRRWWKRKRGKQRARG